MTTTTEPAERSLWREAAAAGAIVLCAALAGGAVAGGFTALAAGSPHGRAAVAERWWSSTERWSSSANRLENGEQATFANAYSRRAGFVLGVWRGGRFGGAAAGLALIVAAFSGRPRVPLWNELSLIAVAALGTATLTALAAGVGAALGRDFPNLDFGYLDSNYQRWGDAGSPPYLAAAVGREALFWSGVGWSAFAALWLRAGTRHEEATAGPVTP